MLAERKAELEAQNNELVLQLAAMHVSPRAPPAGIRVLSMLWPCAVAVRQWAALSPCAALSPWAAPWVTHPTGKSRVSLTGRHPSNRPNDCPNNRTNDYSNDRL